MMIRLSSALVLICLCAVANALELNAELAWADRVTLSVPVSGVIEQVLVQPGAAVNANQTLLSLDSRQAKAHLAAANSAVKRLDLQRAEAEREWDRARELFDRTVLSERELQLAEIGLAQADADYQAAQAAQVDATVALEVHTLKAPFAAWVLAVPAAAGQAVINAQQATPLLTLVARERMRAHALIDVEQANALKIDAAVVVQVGQQRFDAKIAQIGLAPMATQRPAQYLLEVEFNIPTAASLRAGQSAVLELP